MVFPEPDVRANHRCLCTPRGVYVSSKIRISAENNSVRRRRYQKMEIENESLLHSGRRTVVVARHCRHGCVGVGSPGVPKGRPGGRPAPVSTQEILANLAFCGES
jgi:hypothetical protein